jgi:hypothetical protein
MSAVCHMKTFFDKLYAIYIASPKNKTKLVSVALQSNIRVNSVGWVLGTCLESFSARSVRVIWKNYPALHNQEASGNQNCVGSESTYAGLKTILCDAYFMLNLGLMLDALTMLEHLSLKLQYREVILPKAHYLIFQKYHVWINDSKPGGILRRSTKCSQ